MYCKVLIINFNLTNKGFEKYICIDVIVLFLVVYIVFFILFVKLNERSCLEGQIKKSRLYFD